MSFTKSDKSDTFLLKSDSEVTKSQNLQKSAIKNSTQKAKVE